jgi:hypothetical protein
MFLKRCFLLFVLFASLISCNKTVQRDKLLQGSWNLKKVTVYDYDGLSYSTDTSCVGELIIDKELDTSFLLNFSYSIFPTFSGTTSAKGRYLLKDDAEYFSHEFLTVTNPNLIPGSHSRVLFLSNDYFKWEFFTTPGIRYQLIFEKK